MKMMWILVLIAWNGTITTVPDFYSKNDCQLAGQAWVVEAKDTGRISDPRYVCFPAAPRFKK